MFETISPCTPGWPETDYRDQAGFALKDPPGFVSQVLE